MAKIERHRRGSKWLSIGLHDRKADITTALLSHALLFSTISNSNSSLSLRQTKAPNLKYTL
jgi:hypothetical protein